jgi:hypothetical protein
MVEAEVKQEDMPGSVYTGEPNYKTSYRCNITKMMLYREYVRIEKFGVFTNDKAKYDAADFGKCLKFREENIKKCGFKYFIECKLESYENLYKPFGDKRF